MAFRLIAQIVIFTLSDRQRNITYNSLASVCLSVCPVYILIVTACDAASVHFGPSIRRTDILLWFLQQLTKLLRRSREQLAGAGERNRNVAVDK